VVRFLGESDKQGLDRAWLEPLAEAHTQISHLSQSKSAFAPMQSTVCGGRIEGGILPVPMAESELRTTRRPIIRLCRAVSPVSWFSPLLAYELPQGSMTWLAV